MHTWHMHHSRILNIWRSTQRQYSKWFEEDNQRGAGVNITTVSQSLQVWHELLSHQDKHRVGKLLERLEINMSMAETRTFSDGCVLGKAL